MKAKKTVVNKVIRLIEKECLTTKEILDKVDCSESTIKRIRKEYDIGKRNMTLKKDKSYVCSYCGEITYIRRNERPRLLCPSCRMKHRGINVERSD